MIPVAIRADARYRIVDEPRIVEQLMVNGWAREIHRGGRAHAAEATSAALERWVGAGLPFVTSNDGGRRFDPAEVHNFMKRAGLHDGDPFLKDHFVATCRELIRDFHAASTAGGAPPRPHALKGERFVVTLQREFDLRGPPAGARTLLRLPLPIEDDALRELRVEPIAPPDADVRFNLRPGRLDARFSAPPHGRVAVGARLSFTAYPTLPEAPSAPVAAADVELYTRPHEGLIKISPRVRALAAELSGTERDPWKVVARFWSHIHEELTCGVLHYDELDPINPVDSVLEHGWFDCQMGSALMIALCRARGIPARMLGGYQLYRENPAQHYWSEIWTDARGWAPVDTMGWDISCVDRDTAWRDLFFGRLDYRMKTQCLPRLFSQNPAMPFPPVWHVLIRAEGDGLEQAFFANDTGALVYGDRLSVLRADGNR
jgi:Transglutaminase-like superfamily